MAKLFKRVRGLRITKHNRGYVLMVSIFGVLFIGTEVLLVIAGVAWWCLPAIVAPATIIMLLISQAASWIGDEY